MVEKTANSLMSSARQDRINHCQYKTSDRNKSNKGQYFPVQLGLPYSYYYIFINIENTKKIRLDSTKQWQIIIYCQMKDLLY